MGKISDELRKWCDANCWEESGDYLRELADRIDAEMVELPKDRDGVPIHVGDTLYNSGKKYVVTCISTDYCDHSFGFYANYNNNIAYNPEAFTHERPDSLERIAEELDVMVESTDFADDAQLADLADRIRKLAEKENER